jgi:CheY-like chemotaxis protein
MTDIDMPIVNGLALVRRIRSLNAAVPIILSTGLSGSGVEKRNVEFEKLGVKTILSKPYTTTKILTALQEVLAPA